MDRHLGAPLELALILGRLPRPGWRPSSALPSAGDSPRISPLVAGLVARIASRRCFHARIRATERGGLVVDARGTRRWLRAEPASRCIAELREAASLEAAAPHAAGTFTLLGRAVRVETYACHRGWRAFVHLAGGPAPRLDPALRDVMEADAETMGLLFGEALSPEHLLLARWHAASADAASVLVRHADFAVAAAALGLPCAQRLAASLRAMLAANPPGASEALAEWIRGGDSQRAEATDPLGAPPTMLARARRLARRLH